MSDLVISDSALVPVMNTEAALSTYNAFREFVQGILKPNVDFGVIPGTNKPSLLKPGAEKLTRFFGLAARFEITKETEDWDAAEPLFYYRYRCALHRISDGALVGEGEGSCNSREKKYRYRNADRICPNCGQPYIIKGKEEYGGGWICFTKKGGCGNKWPDGAQVIEGQQVGQVLNTDNADLVNTIQKMAQKRALIAAVLVACNASDYFTQDLEDLDYGNPVPFAPQKHNGADFEGVPLPVIEAEFTDTHSAQHAATMAKVETKASKTAKPVQSAPRDPETIAQDFDSQYKGYLKDRGVKAVEEYDINARGILVSKLNKLCGNDEHRHVLLDFLIGQDTIKGINNAHGWLLTEWAGSKHAQAETDLILYAVGAIDGAQGLYPEPPVLD